MRKIATNILEDKLLKKLVCGAGSLSQARNELRWLKQEIKSTTELERAVQMRGRAYPLQYILKSQPFGELDILCEPDALIPRWETEEWSLKLVNEIKQQGGPKPTKILDICTGTGCILFLLCKMLNTKGVGIDISSAAINVFLKNQEKLQMQSTTSSECRSLFDPLTNDLRECDLVVSNPPYILNKSDVEYSVSQYEPDIALYEPPNLWPALVNRTLETRASRAVFEIGEESQFKLLRELFKNKGWHAEGQKDSNGQFRTVWAYKQ